jgi:hypothetical protein
VSVNQKRFSAILRQRRRNVAKKNGDETNSERQRAKSHARAHRLQAYVSRSILLKPRGGPRISRRIIESRKPDVEVSNAAMPVLDFSSLVIVGVTRASTSASTLVICDGAVGNGPSRTSKVDGTIFAGLKGRGGGISSRTISRFRGFSRLSCESGDIGGCTGASERGGISVRGTTGGGGREVEG